MWVVRCTELLRQLNWVSSNGPYKSSTLINLINRGMHTKQTLYKVQWPWSKHSCTHMYMYMVRNNTKYIPLGESVTAGIECMWGSATYFMSTGIFLEGGREGGRVGGREEKGRGKRGKEGGRDGGKDGRDIGRRRTERKEWRKGQNRGKKEGKENLCLYTSTCGEYWLTHHSQTRRLLSSDVVTNRLFSSTNVMVFTAPRCRSYSCITSSVSMSNWGRRGMEGGTHWHPILHLPLFSLRCVHTYTYMYMYMHIHNVYCILY